MNGPGEISRQPKFARVMERAHQTHKHAHIVLELAERLGAELIGSAPQPPQPEPEESPVPGSLVDQLDRLVVLIDRTVDRIETHLARLAAEMTDTGPQTPRRPVAIER